MCSRAELHSRDFSLHVRMQCLRCMFYTLYYNTHSKFKLKDPGFDRVGKKGSDGRPLVSKLHFVTSHTLALKPEVSYPEEQTMYRYRQGCCLQCTYLASQLLFGLLQPFTTCKQACHNLVNNGHNLVKLLATMLVNCLSQSNYCSHNLSQF